MAIIIYDTYFSQDWNTREGSKNGKLQCSHFTTLRLYSAQYAVGTIHRIWNKNGGKNAQNIGYAVVIKQMYFKLKEIEKFDVLCRLDTGYAWQETKKLMLNIYKQKGINDETLLNFALMRFLTKVEIERMTEKLKSDSQTTIL